MQIILRHMFCVLVFFGVVGTAQAERIFEPINNDIPSGEVIIAGDPRDRLRSPQSLFLRERRADRIKVLWSDSTNVETGYRIERADVGQRWERPVLADFQEIAATGPRDGFPEIIDTGLIPEQHYCYRIIALGEAAEIPSAVRCVVTTAAQTQPVFRVQLKLHTADVNNAETDDDIEVLLNHRAVIEPTGNSTWINYSRNDFERGDIFSYDLNFNNLRRISDITQIYIDKPGSDDWCVTRVELVVNELSYFDQSFAALPDGCVWLNNDTDRRLIVPFNALRNHASWGRFDPGVIALFTETTSSFLKSDDGSFTEGILVTALLPGEKLGLEHGDMHSRIEGIIGDIIATQPAHWLTPARGEDSTLHLVRVDQDTYRVFFRLIGEGPLGSEARISARVDLDISATCNETASVVRYSLVAQNLNVGADYVVWWLENNIEDAIESRFSVAPVAQQLSLEGLPEGMRCIGVPVTINGAGDLEIRLLLAKFFSQDLPDNILDPILPGDDADEPEPPVVAPATKKYGGGSPKL